MAVGKHDVTYNHHTGGDDLLFFDDRKAWRCDVKKRHPRAAVKYKKGISRAYIGEQLVAVFGALPGHGYVAGSFVAMLLHERDKRPLSRDRDYSLLRGRRSLEAQ